MYTWCVHEISMAKSKEKVDSNQVAVLREFSFPAYSLTILAADIREAEEKLQEVLNNNPQ